MTIHVSITEAEASFATLIARAAAGEDIIVTRNGHPVARLTPIAPQPIAYGDLAGLRLADDLALPEDIIADFERPS